MDTKNDGIGVYVNLLQENGSHQLALKFLNSGVEGTIPLSPSQYKHILGLINNDFVTSVRSPSSLAPAEDDSSLVSGLRYMIPFEDLNGVYESADRNSRIIMVHVDPLKEEMLFYRVSPKPNNKVVSFSAPMGWMKTLPKADLGKVQIVNQGKAIRFGDLDIASTDLISWFGHNYKDV